MMLTTDFNQALLEHYVPAFITPDDSIFQRMLGFLQDAQMGLLAQIGCNADKYVAQCAELAPFIEEYVYKKAALRAIPHLDLVLTETGFGVVSNGNVAPASRDRVQALADALRRETSMAHDRIIEWLISYTGWGMTDEAKRVVDNFVYLPSMLYGSMTYKGKRIYEDEFAEMRPMLIIAAEKAKKIISAELYDEVLKRVRENDKQINYRMVYERTLSYMVTYLAEKPLRDMEHMLIQTVEFLAENLPEYTHSSVYMARHAEHYENKKDDPVYFFG